MITYEILDRKKAKYLFRHGLAFQKIASVFIAIYYFSVEVLFKRNILGLISKYFYNNSTKDNIMISVKNYYYETFYIFNYGWMLYGRFNKVVKTLESKTKIINYEVLKSILLEEKPIILVTGHVGFIYNAIFTCAKYLHNREVACLFPNIDGELRKQLLEERVGSLGIKTINIFSKIGGLKMARVLKKNGVIICTMDYAYPYTRNKRVKFLNRNIELPVGVVEMAMKFDAKIIPYFSYIEKGSFTFEIGQPIHLIKSNNTEEDIMQNLSAIANVIEQKASEKPEHYTMWQHLLN